MLSFFNKHQKPKEKQEIIVEHGTVNLDKCVSASNCIGSKDYSVKYIMPDGKVYFVKRNDDNICKRCKDDGDDPDFAQDVLVRRPDLDLTRKELTKALLDFDNKFPELQEKLEAF